MEKVNKITLSAGNDKLIQSINSTESLEQAKI